MVNSFLVFSVNSKRDLLRVRQLTRNTAVILGFEPLQCTSLAAAVFDLACQRAEMGLVRVRFGVGEGCLNIDCTSVRHNNHKNAKLHQEAFCVSKELPGGQTLAAEDLSWALRQMAELAPLDVFEEVQKLNQELLQSLLQQKRQRDDSFAQEERRAA